jgi:hypothetical protein
MCVILTQCGVAQGVDVEVERDQAGAWRDYISDMLAELAELAASHGDRRLALTLQLAAIDAARPSAERAPKAG